MQLLFKVDQAEALRRGIDAPTSTVRIEVNPADLTEDEREALAKIVTDGHDCTRRGLPFGASDRTEPPVLIEQSVDGVRAAMAALLNKRAEVISLREKRIEEARREMRAAIAAVAAGPRTRNESVYVRRAADGSIEETHHHYLGAGAGGPVPFLEWPRGQHVRGVAIEPDLAPYSELIEEVEDERLRARASLREEAEARLIEREQREAAEKGDRDALHARLPEALRAREVDGYASEEEVEDSMIALAVADAGFEPRAEPKSWGRVEELTDAEHASLRAIRERSPIGAVVDAVEEWQEAEGEWGDFVPTNVRRLARIRWDVGGLEVEAWEPLS